MMSTSSDSSCSITKTTDDTHLQLKEGLQQLDLDHQGLLEFIISNRLYFEEVVNYINLRGEFFIMDSLPDSDPRCANLFKYWAPNNATGQAEERVCKGVETRFNLGIDGDGVTTRGLATFHLKEVVLNKLRPVFDRYLLASNQIKRVVSVVSNSSIAVPCDNETKAKAKCFEL